MIIAGNCSLCDEEDKEEIITTAKRLVGVADLFRCKIWLGGTVPEKYKNGIGGDGLATLEKINNNILPAGTEVQTTYHVNKCMEYVLNYIWVGARNCQNYGLLKYAAHYGGDLMLKRGFGMTIDETIGIYDIMQNINHKKVYIIERGITTFDRKPESRWSPDLKGVIEIKHRRPDIFDRLIVDCSHSVFIKDYIEDTYKAFKAIGVNHFMFECANDPEKAKTDKEMCLSIEELKKILGE